MPQPRQRPEERLQQDAADSEVKFHGDAHIALTAPFFPDGDPLAPREEAVLPPATDLDGTGTLLRADIPMHAILKGTLTYQHPVVGALTGFTCGVQWLGELKADLERFIDIEFDQVQLSGLLFPDGYGSVALTVRFPGGWEPGRRDATLRVIGRAGREDFAAAVRARLLPPLERLLRRSYRDRLPVAILPYFNLTYVGSTSHPAPGRSCLPDDLRHLVNPNSPMPLPSCSPWHDEYLYAGYAYNVIAARDPLPSLQRFMLLLLVLNVSYARLAHLSAAADGALKRHDFSTSSEWLSETVRRLRSEYQSLITPTFSFDPHMLKVRDAVLESWDVPKLMDRADNLISMLRGAVEIRMAGDQARRIQRLNRIVFFLTVLSVVATIEATLSIFDMLFK